MTYELTPGTAAYRIVGWLEAQGKTREFIAAHIGEALGIKPGALPALLEPALAARLVFRRQKDRTRPTAPWFYSLTDHDAQQRQFTRSKPADWMPRPANLEPEVEPDTPQGDQPRSERGRVIFRDGGRCLRCGSTSSLVADHIVSRRNGGSHHPSNLQCLCDSCNARKSVREDRRQ